MSSEKVSDLVMVESQSSEAPLSQEPAFSTEDHLEPIHHTWTEIAASGKWYDRRLVKFLPPYSHAMTQLVIMSFVLFLTPGCFNAITGIGNSGISDPTVADNANVALYSTFATVGAFGGVICNVVGIRACLMFGGTGYLMYTTSLLVFHYTGNKAFPVFAGAYLGVCAAVTWAAQGSIMMSYALENAKGKAIMVFWVIFNFGAVIGSLIPLGQNMTSGESNVNAGTYVAFMVLMGAGIVLAFFLLPMDKVYKADGTRVIAKKYPKFMVELRGMWHVLKTERKIYFMFPMFCASNWFYTYQFNDFNGARFNVRTRSLNSLLYWLSQMVGAIMFGTIMDYLKWRRATRAKVGFFIVFIAGMAIWGGGLKFQMGVTRENVLDLGVIDFHDSSYIGPMFLYMFYGVFDAIYQGYIFWILGTFSNNPKKVALYASFYKSLQSAFAAILWRLDAIGVSYMALFASSWALAGSTMLIAAPVCLFRISDHTTAEQDGIAEILDEDEIKSIKSHIEKV